MPRYFIELAYKGTHYSGFQVQQNANTIQSEVEAALKVIFKIDIHLTGSSRTDAGVHAKQNFFHFDVLHPIPEPEKRLYNLNAVLPDDIVINNLFRVDDEAHCRFDAVYREYQYFIYQSKDPFLKDRAWYYPYQIDMDKMQQAAAILYNYTDFTSFSKKNTQVNNFHCTVHLSEWQQSGNQIKYTVRANRFLRGMVKGLVGTMIRVGTGKLSIEAFENVIKARDCSKADFSVPSHGLFLMQVHFK